MIIKKKQQKNLYNNINNSIRGRHGTARQPKWAWSKMTRNVFDEAFINRFVPITPYVKGLLDVRTSHMGISVTSAFQTLFQWQHFCNLQLFWWLSRCSSRKHSAIIWITIAFRWKALQKRFLVLYPSLEVGVRAGLGGLLKGQTAAVWKWWGLKPLSFWSMTQRLHCSSTTPT